MASSEGFVDRESGHVFWNMRLAIRMDSEPLILMMPIPPNPTGVAIAAMVSILIDSLVSIHCVVFENGIHV
jgi:hypothetical protein